MSFSQFLPEPKHQSSAPARAKAATSTTAVTAAAAGTAIPQQGRRKGWVPKTEADFGGGGAYPEIHVLQYPLGMGRKRSAKGNAVAKQVDSSGNISYEALARHGTRESQVVQSTFKELVPLAERVGFSGAVIPARPTAESVEETAERTRRALDRIASERLGAKGTAAKGAAARAEPTYVRYTPNQQAPGFNSGAAQRLVRVSEMPVDPLEPPKVKHQKAARRPGSPPAPVMHSPPRKLTADEQRDWIVPPCVSNWKNIHGFTVSLDKRLAADGRGLEDVQVSDGFARLAEALGSAESHAREEIAERAQIQQTLARREKEGKEERLRLLAQRAREERAEKKSAAGAEERAEYVAPPLSPLAAVRRRDPNRKAATDFFNEPGSKATHDHGHEHEHEHNHNHNHNHNQDQDQDQGHDHGHGADAAVRERDQLRAERRKQHERDLRQQRSGGGSGKKPRDDRDVSEKIALGLAKPTSMSRESMFDSRLFNQPSASNAQLQNDEAYNLYDKPLFSSAPHQTYRPRADADDGQQQAGDVERLMESDRFGGQGGLRGGAKRPRAVEAGKPVVFEKEADVFGIDAFVGSTRSSEDKRPRNQ